ncbi:Fic family protein [Tsukamurella strandjordii]|uniref:Fic family protein n=1 Tax=Tsukamurella strandjordii TaxID=147577 RepID=A0AA90SMC7_9ACTN|nr:Fic family protein [Tsukamurella strandjordii]MDP0399187.1 Fic family protein [Tsukamurella strandjordii]
MSDDVWGAIRAELRGCPYSLPDDRDIESCITMLREREGELRQGVDKAVTALKNMGLRQEVKWRQQHREIYESNAIEFAGADSLAETSQILNSRESAEAQEALAKGMLATAITREPKRLDVLGLNNARVLANNILDGLNEGRPLTEADIRDMHRHTVPTKSFAGRYKRLPNEILGSDHAPPLPDDVPIAMQELVGWVNGCVAMPATLTASIAHAWFAHVHPFDDGNGRVARLLVNLILAKHDLPPVIINHRSKRDDYIDALALSDEAGDIFPLTKFLVDSQKRFVREIGTPKNLRQIFNEYISNNEATDFRQWSRAFNSFFLELSAQLAQRHMYIHPHGDIDALTYKRLVNGSYEDEQWIATVSGPRRGSAEVRIGISVPPSEIYNALDTKDRFPGFYLQIRTPFRHDDPRRNLWFGSTFSGIQAITIRPGSRDRVYVSYAGSPSRLQWGYEADAADTLATALQVEIRNAPAGLGGQQMLW